MGAVTCGCAGAQVVPSLLGQDQNTNSQKMTFWQENYTFIKDVYDMRHTKMAEWMEMLRRPLPVSWPTRCTPPLSSRGRGTTSMHFAKIWSVPRLRNGCTRFSRS